MRYNPFHKADYNSKSRNGIALLSPQHKSQPDDGESRDIEMRDMKLLYQMRATSPVAIVENLSVLGFSIIRMYSTLSRGIVRYCLR